VHKLCAEDKRNLLKVARAVRFMDAAQKAIASPPGSTNLVGVSVEEVSQSAPINVADRQLADFTDDEIAVLLKKHDLESLVNKQEARVRQ
jgi:hypothetical protein